MSYPLYYTKQAQKDAKKLTKNQLKQKVQTLLNIIEQNPYQNPPPYEKLVGDLDGALSRRINIQHRLVYQVIKKLNSFIKPSIFKIFISYIGFYFYQFFML